jgi:hypothetical protein
MEIRKIITVRINVLRFSSNKIQNGLMLSQTNGIKKISASLPDYGKRIMSKPISDSFFLLSSHPSQ